MALTHTGADPAGVVDALALLAQHILPAITDEPTTTEASDRPSPAFDAYTVAPNGTGRHPVEGWPAGALATSWSPDGTRIAFSRGEPADGDLYSVGAQGDGLRRLTRFAGFEQSPTWSPDGEQIAFVRGRGGPDVRGWAEDGALWVMDADGSQPRHLLDDAIAYPAWSPDGEHIAVELRGRRPHDPVPLPPRRGVIRPRCRTG